MTAQPDPHALAARIQWAIDRETLNLPMKANPATIAVLQDCLAALRTDQDVRPAAEGVRHTDACNRHNPWPTHSAAGCVKQAAVAAAMAERESDGDPWWVDRFGDNVAPERGR